MHVMAIFEKLFLKNKKSLSVDHLKLAKNQVLHRIYHCNTEAWLLKEFETSAIWKWDVFIKGIASKFFC